jgi:glutamine synthetase
MDILTSVFSKHGYVVLFHEKPFIGANGSGKHCNWSIAFNKGETYCNIFEPGKDPEKNTLFKLWMVMTLKALQSHSGLFKASVTSPSNEHRMGGQEAPPCIISAFLGSYIDELLNSHENGTPFNP